MLLDLGEAQERPGWIAIARNRCDWLEDVCCAPIIADRLQADSEKCGEGTIR